MGWMPRSPAWLAASRTPTGVAWCAGWRIGWWAPPCGLARWRRSPASVPIPRCWPGRAHVALARDAGVEPAIYRSPGTQFDVDTAGDLAELRGLADVPFALPVGTPYARGEGA